MDYDYRNPELELALASAKTIDDVDAALTQIIRFTTRLKEPGVLGRLFWPELDAQLTRTAHRLKLADQPGQKSNENVCVLGTVFYHTGGHSRVVSDFTRRLPRDRAAAVIATDAYKALDLAWLLNHANLSIDYGERAFMALQAPSLGRKVIELYQLLKALRPTRIVLACHPMDVVACMAAWPFRDVVEFLHHADHVPALGATLFPAHVDLTYACHLACREAGRRPLFAGMAAERTQAPAAGRREGPLRLATCGSMHKYQGAAGHRWADYVAGALRGNETQFFHIGPTDPAFEAPLHDALAAAGVAPQRYAFVGFKPSLPHALRDLGIDVFVSSYPESGDKANIEAMATDVPIVVPTEEAMVPLYRFASPLRRFVEVSRPEDMPQAIARALELGRSFGAPEQASLLERELGRFDAFVAGRLAADSALAPQL